MPSHPWPSKRLQHFHVLQEEIMSAAFFDVLARVGAIHANCRRLLRTHHQRAGLELMDAMSAHQETAYERLCRSASLAAALILTLTLPVGIHAA